MEIFGNDDFSTQILVASIRNPVYVLTAAKLGAHVSTILFGVIAQLATQPLTDAGIKRFLADWEKVPKK